MHNCEGSTRRLQHLHLPSGSRHSKEHLSGLASARAIDEIVDKGYNLLEDHYHQAKPELEDKTMDKFEKFQQKYSIDDKEVKKTLIKDAELTILNES